MIGLGTIVVGSAVMTVGTTGVVTTGIAMIAGVVTSAVTTVRVATTVRAVMTGGGTFVVASAATTGIAMTRAR